MPKARRNNRWEHKRVLEGFVSTGTTESGDHAFAHFFVDGKAWRKSLRPIRFIGSHKPAALTILCNLAQVQAWRFPASRVRVHSDGSVETPDMRPEFSEATSMTVDDLYQMFRRFKEGQLREGKVAADAPRKIRDAYRRYFDGERDFYLADSKGILEHVLAKTTDLDLSDDSKRQYLSRLRAMFEHGVGLDLIVKNPLPEIRRIVLRSGESKDGKGRQRRAYTQTEYEKLKSAAYEKNRELGLLLELYYLTGMRVSEAVTLRLAESWLEEGYSHNQLSELPHVDPGNFLYICGKGRNGKAKWRVFPLENPPLSDTSKRAEWKRSTYEVVQALVDEVATRNKGRLCRWSSRTVQLYLLEARRAAKLPPEVDQHALRHTALTYMTNELRLDEKFIDCTVGNSETIRSKHYVGPATAEQLRRMV